MKRTASLLQLLIGLCMLCSCLSHQYHFVNINKSWTEAQSYCREIYTDLATVDGAEEMNRLKQAVGSGYERSVWIGLNKTNSYTWQWSLADRGFYAEGETEFRNWDGNQPDNAGSEKCCVEMKNNGKWSDVSCDDGGFFICYDENTQNYHLIEEEKTWREAQSYCREKHTDLVSVRNQAENDEIKNLLKHNKPVWLGLFRDSWKWSDQSKSSFRNWKEGEPNNQNKNENCVDMILESRKWNDRYCGDKLPFICYDDNLVLVDKNKSWNEALSYCREHYVDLVSVSTEKLQHWVGRRAQNASTPHVWLGLRYTCVLHFWFWVSGEGVCYQNWAPGNGTGECGHTGTVESGEGHQWVSLPETEELNFICSNYSSESGKPIHY